MNPKGFTLIELLIVIAIMGLMGTLSVSGYRSMRRGMEQSSVQRSVSQFIRNACQRAQIDRQPTAVFFWNEVRREETDDGDSLIVVGRAVAVRTTGRISHVEGEVLVDEFGNLESLKVYKDNDGSLEEDEDAAEDGPATYIYRMTGSGEWSNCRCAVGQAPGKTQPMQLKLLLGGGKPSVSLYGYYLRDGTTWKAGMSYGSEFAEMTLPNNYIFGTKFPKDVDAQEEDMDAGVAIWFNPGDAEKTVVISAIRPKGKDLVAEALPAQKNQGGM